MHSFEERGEQFAADNFRAILHLDQILVNSAKEGRADVAIVILSPKQLAVVILLKVASRLACSSGRSQSVGQEALPAQHVRLIGWRVLWLSVRRHREAASEHQLSQRKVGQKHGVALPHCRIRDRIASKPHVAAAANTARDQRRAHEAGSIG
eukprot:3004579-Prymnesium_polylepis.1